MKFLEVEDESSIKELLKGVVVGSKIRITFKPESGPKLYKILTPLRHKLQFDVDWLTIINHCVEAADQWEGIPRTQDFTITRMSGTDREVFANILVEIAESIEIL